MKDQGPGKSQEDGKEKASNSKTIASHPSISAVLTVVVVVVVVVAVDNRGIPPLKLQDALSSFNLKCFLTKMCISRAVKMTLATLKIVPIKILAAFCL